MAAAAPKSGEFADGKFWFERKGTSVRVGMTTQAVEEVGSVESFEFPSQGDDFEKGDIVVTVSGSNGKIEVTAPASGIIEEINEAVIAEPEIVTDDPFEQGWLVKLEIQDTSDLKEFTNGDD